MAQSDGIAAAVHDDSPARVFAPSHPVYLINYQGREIKRY